MKTRIISAIVAIILVFPFIYFGGKLYAVGVGLIAIQAFREIYNLKKSHKQIPLVCTIIAIISMLLLIYTNFDGESVKYGVTYMRIIFLELGLLIPTLFYKEDGYTSKDAFYLMGASIFLGVAFNCFILVRDIGLNLFVFLILIPMITDAFALFVGKAIGKHKMCPLISPHKTWEGAVGGLIFGTLIPVILYYFLVGQVDIKVIIGTMFLSCMGQIGDLIFSEIKRENGIKDYSNIMPGHGGALDRLDSTIIIFMAYIYITAILF